MNANAEDEHRVLRFNFITHFQRFSRSDKRNKLPKWIQEHLKDSLCNLSTEEAIQVSFTFVIAVNILCSEDSPSLKY